MNDIYRTECSPLDDVCGSHMPLDTISYWEWRNPLNCIPALFLIALAVALITLIAS